jgi:hypothetical protein
MAIKPIYKADHLWVQPMAFAEMASSAFNVFMMVCAYAIMNAVVEISKSLRGIKSSTEAMNHYLFILTRELRKHNSVSWEPTAENTSMPKSDSLFPNTM